MNACIRAAVFSVSNKANLVPLARVLVAHGTQILSSGGSHQALTDAGIVTTEISAYTGMPEMMDGRVKTLHPKIHGGILARRGIDDNTVREHEITYIDLVVVNLYPFASVTADQNCDVTTAIEHIDIGGAALIRSAAKNHAHTLVVTDPSDYQAVIDAIQAGDIPQTLRYQLAVKAFRHTAIYDTVIYEYLNAQNLATDLENAADFLLYGRKGTTLRYGENPQQQATVYKLTQYPAGLVNAEQLNGEPLSYNNWNDVTSAYGCVSPLPTPSCVIVKHASPCAVATGNDTTSAYQRAFSADTISAFGGVIAFNRPLTADTFDTILRTQFTEVIIAAGIEEKDRDVILARVAKKPKLRLLIAPAETMHNQPHVQTISGGFMVQQAQAPRLLTVGNTRHVAGPPVDQDFTDCRLAWQVVAWVKSNAVVLVKNGVTIGIGCGQSSRVRSVEIALEDAERAGLDVRGSVLASDAFFPFRDGIDILAPYGISTVIQPGGSMRDAEVIAAASEHRICLLFTDHRVFRH